MSMCMCMYEYVPSMCMHQYVICRVCTYMYTLLYYMYHSLSLPTRPNPQPAKSASMPSRLHMHCTPHTDIYAHTHSDVAGAGDFGSRTR